MISITAGVLKYEHRNPANQDPRTHRSGASGEFSSNSRFLLTIRGRKGDPTSDAQEERREARLMADKPSELVQGTLDMLILKTLDLQPMHGYGISVRIEQMSQGVFRVNAGSLFVALQRLQRAGLIKSEWKTTENCRRAKYYALTQQGRSRLNSETREWGRQVAAITRILEAS